MYLFVVYKTIGGGEAELMGIEPGVHVLVVELETGSGQRGL